MRPPLPTVDIQPAPAQALQQGRIAGNWQFATPQLGGSLPIVIGGEERTYPRPIFEARRCLTAKPSERLSKQEGFWKDLLSKRMSA
jgi:hypothetical protein